MGVWIETKSMREVINEVNVTPFVGVWIETTEASKISTSLPSHPSWVCGLKPSYWGQRTEVRLVTPFVGVWIETVSPYISVKQ